MELFNITKPFKFIINNIASKTILKNGEISNKLKHKDIKIHFNYDNTVKEK